ncbi:DUF2889 domain-containing protein [Heliorestis convoluta]|uniref:DUF2889 domain-containing protein n=1 Tax=Heliorestis convoluta TaxID=356322 RepID=A0A5Q2MWM6_9FIRM|nr:DUF2889 domain-containing protein [Heliorestis convoluta]QGG46747.1 hypothetical protein FTV88_0568 [Heliorestis convoluta]
MTMPNKNLYNRQMTVRAFRREDGHIDVQCFLIDTFHEISAQLTFTFQGEVIDGHAYFIRCPYDICEKSVSKMTSLRGIIVGPGSSKQIRQAIGGGEGCEHLVEITIEAFRAFVQCRFRMDIEGVTDPFEVFEDFQEKLKDSCYAYSHPEQIREIRWWGHLPVQESVHEKTENKKKINKCKINTGRD